MLRTLGIRTLVVGLGVVSWVVASASHAATRTWDGGVADDSNWTNASNWDAVAPVPGADDLVFAGTNDLAPNNDFTADSVFNGITFNATAGIFTLGGNGIVLAGDISNTSGKAQTIGFAPVNVVAPGLTYVGGGLVLDGATSNVNVSAGGSLNLGQVTFGLAPLSANVSTLNINNSVAASGLTVQTNSAGVNTINIATGQTFTVNGGVFLGTPSTVTASGNIPTNVTFAGGGNLVTGGGNFFVGLGSQNFTGGDRNVARVDMTALSSFTYSTGTTGTGLFGVGWMTRPDGQLRLSNTANTIVADVVGVGNSGITGTNSSPNNSGETARLFLGGGTNVINADNINIGAVKGAGSIEWDAAVTTGTLTVAGQDGVGRANITIGNQTSATGDNEASFLSLAGHSVNVLANTVQVGRLGGATGGTVAGNVTFDTGTFDINSLQIAVNASGTAANGVLGTFTMGGGSLTVNNAFIIGNDTSTAVTGKTDATFTLNGGTVTSNAPITRVVTSGVLADVAVLNLNGGTLNMTGKDIGSAATPLTSVNLAGGNLTNAARIAGTAISLGATVNITGTPTFVVPDTGTLTSSLTSLNLVSGGGIEGGGATGATVSGNVVAQTGSHITVGLGATASTLSFGNDLSLNGGSTVNMDLSDNPLGANDVINVAGNLSVAGTVNVNIGSLGAGATVGNMYTLINYSGILAGNQTNFTVGSGGTRKTFTVVNTNTTPNAIQVAVGGSNSLALTWIGNVNNEWDLIGDANWNSGGPQQFFNGDSVTFNDTSTNLNAVQLVGNLLPASVTVDATRNYTFAGTGSIAGGATLTKQGTGTLTVTNANSYTGGTQIGAGVVEIGNGGTLGTGEVANAAALRFNRTDTSTFANVISGAGTVNHNGTGTTTLSGTNTYTGATNIQAGTVQVTNSASLGDTVTSVGAVTISNGAALDVGGSNTGNVDFGNLKEFFVQGTGVGGTGVLTNSNATVGQNNPFEKVTLTGPATFGGAGRFDIRLTDTVNNTANLNLQGHTLTKVGPNQFTLVGVTVDDGNIVVNEGTFAIETTTSILAGAGTKLTFNDGTTLGFFNKSGIDLTRPIELNGGVTIRNGDDNTNSTFDSPVTMKGSATYTWVNATGTGNATTQNGVISEMGGARGIELETVNALNLLNLTADNTFTGSVAVSGPGTLNITPLSGTPYLGNTANVSLDTNSILGLNYNGTDTIGALLINGVSVTPGVYGPGATPLPQLTSTLTGTLTVTSQILLPGDFDNNNRVDAADYVKWRDNAGTFNTLVNDPLSGTEVDADQYNIWRSNFGNSIPGSGGGFGQSGQVPEPGALVLALFAMVGAMFLRSRGA